MSLITVLAPDTSLHTRSAMWTKGELSQKVILHVEAGRPTTKTIVTNEGDCVDDKMANFARPGPMTLTDCETKFKSNGIGVPPTQDPLWDVSQTISNQYFILLVDCIYNAGFGPINPSRVILSMQET